VSTLARVGGLFVETHPPRAIVVTPDPVAPPTIAVLCATSRSRVAAAVVSLALARVLSRRCALTAALGTQTSGPGAGMAAPAARRAAQRLRERDVAASPSGRLVWLDDRRRGEVDGADAPAVAAAVSAELGRAALLTAAPAALAIPLARLEALDRVLGWHDGIVVMPEPDSVEPILERALASLALLGRPVALMPPPSRLDARVAMLGLRAPAAAIVAVGQLLLDGDRERDRTGRTP
jgi:hypothetical protein